MLLGLSHSGIVAPLECSVIARDAFLDLDHILALVNAQKLAILGLSDLLGGLAPIKSFNFKDRVSIAVDMLY